MTAQGEGVCLKAIQPTVFFVRTEEGLKQGVDLVVRNDGEPLEGTVAVRFGSQEFREEIGLVRPGEGAYRVNVPDIRESVSAEFVLLAGGKEQDRHTMAWTPQRRWTVYMVPIAHHDFGYTDTIENVLRSYGGYYDEVLRFCAETDGFPEESRFRYMAEEAWSVQHFVDTRPGDVVERFMERAKEGRIEVPALFGNEISGLCGHEELIRLLYPSFRLKREYGIPVRTAGITDIPGLSWGLASAMAGAGVQYFFAGLPTYFSWGGREVHPFWDPSEVLRGLPDAFWWEGPDGGRVLVYYQAGYGVWTPSEYGEAMEQLPGMLRGMEKAGCPFDVVRYAYRGGDNQPPDVRVSYLAREWNSRWAYPRMVVGTNAMFFEELERQCADVRTFRGELPDTDYVVGALSSARETGVNRITHDRLPSAEKLATVASGVADLAYPDRALREAYDDLLMYDEHTWGMSRPIGEVKDWNWSDKSRCAYRAAGLTQSVIRSSLNAVADRVRRDHDGRHILVFNPLSFSRTDVVRVPDWAVDEAFDLVDEETGEAVPYQIVRLDSPHAPVPYAAHRYAMGEVTPSYLFELVFVAEDVPSLGYKTYRVVPTETPATFPSCTVVDDASLENRFFKVAFDPETGAIASLYDKELERELVDGQAPHRLNQFIARWAKTGEEEGPRNVTLHAGQRGLVYASLLVSSEGAGCPRITQEVVLYEHMKRVDFANRVLKDFTPLMELYFAFPFDIEHPQFRYEGSNSVIEPLRDQFPGSNTDCYTMQHWADVSDGRFGVTFAGVEAHLVEFGGLWPGYVSQAHHGVAPPGFGHAFLKPGELTKGHIYSYVLDSNFRTNFHPAQQGDMLWRYSITTHMGDWRQGRPRDFGWAVGNPLMPVCVDGDSDGALPTSMSFCRVDRRNVLLLTLKRAEDGRGIVMRFIETEGRSVRVTVTLPFLNLTQAHRTNLVEEDQEVLPFTAHSVEVPVEPFGLVTIRVQGV